MTTPIEEFIDARVEEIELSAAALPMDEAEGLHQLCHAIRMLIDWHKTWPVLVEGPIETEKIEQSPVASTDTMVFRMMKQFQWMTSEAYVQRFGHDAPTAPIICKIANIWRRHPDFDETWLCTDLPDVDVPATRVET